MLTTKILAAAVLTAATLSTSMPVTANESDAAPLQLSLDTGAVASRSSLPKDTFSAPDKKTDNVTQRLNQAKEILSGLMSFKYSKGQRLKANLGRTSYSVQYISTF